MDLEFKSADGSPEIVNSKYYKAIFGGFLLQLLRDGVAGSQGVVDDGIEIDEPAFEEGLGHGFQSVVHFAVELDFVVQGAEDVGDGALFLYWGKINW